MTSNEPVTIDGGPGRPHRGRRTLAAAMLLLLTFAAGVVVGVAGDRLTLLHSHRVVPRGQARFVSDKVLRVLTHRLDLTAAQQSQVAVILNRHADVIEKASAAVAPVVHEEMKAAHREIEEVLNPEQKARLRKMHSHWKQ